MSQTPAGNSPSPKGRQRVRPRLSWKIPAVIGGILIIFSLGLFSGYILWGQPLSQNQVELENLKAELEVLQSEVDDAEDEASSAATAEPEAIESEIRQVNRYDIEEDDDPSYGPGDAPITIIEFSDFQCPYCQRWHEEVWNKLVAAYPKQIRLVYRDFPLYSIHPEAGPAAEAANCAREQGKYWEMHNLLFSGGMDLGRDAYLKYAADLGMDLVPFEQCLDDKRYEAEVTADYEYALSKGIQSTPTFFINGIALVGAQPYEVFQEVIDLELAGKLSR